MIRTIILLILSILLVIPATSAQDTTIEINGVIESIDGDTIIVNGLPITIANLDPLVISQLVAGATIRIGGDLQDGNVLAITIEIVSLPLPEPGNEVIDIEKYVSVDGGATWHDADAAPGPDVALATNVAFRLVITNVSDTDLTNINLTDSTFDTSGCIIPDPLLVGAFFECNLGPFSSVEGQHSNVATVTAVAGSTAVSDSDAAHYFGGDRPALVVEKYVSHNGSTWADADNEPGPEFDLGDEVSFRIVVFNEGTVPLTNVTLSDDTYDTSGCSLPTELATGDSFECIIGPFAVEDGQHTNVATASATAGSEVLTASDSAHYVGGEFDDDNIDLPVTIVIEGPVENININIITIFDTEIEVDIDDPILNIIQIGDVIRVEGDLVDDSDTIIIIAINIIIIDIDIFINDDGTEVWRDDGNCSNGPPPWAPAHGWRRKCESGDNDGGSNRSQRSNKSTRKSSKRS